MIWTPKQKRIIRPTMLACAGLGLGLGFGGGGSASAPFDPYSISGLTLDLNAESLSVGAVATWANAGSAGGSFTQATAGKRPLLNATAVNGAKGVVFDGVDDDLVSAIALTNIITTTDYTAFALMSYQSSGAADTAPYNHTSVINEPAGPYGALFSMGGTELAGYLFDSGPHRAIEPALDNAVHVNTQWLTGGVLSLQMGAGTIRTQAVAAMSAGSGNVFMGRDYASTVWAAFKLRRLLAWNVALTAPQRAQVYAYLATF